LNEPEKIVRRINLAIAFLLLLVAAPSLGQTQDPVLSLGRIYNSAEFFGQFFGPARWLSEGSGYTTLEPGDVIFTGTPGSTSAMQNGDVVEVEIEGVGILRNSVVRAET
jgi:ABC-type phosphate/phosphonate transport system permease subunit